MTYINSIFDDIDHEIFKNSFQQEEAKSNFFLSIMSHLTVWNGYSRYVELTILNIVVPPQRQRNYKLNQIYLVRFIMPRHA